LHPYNEGVNADKLGPLPVEHMKQSKSANRALKKAPMHRVIYDTFRAAIQRGEYLSGDRLPSETELCKQFQVSRITVAKAIHSLQHDGLVMRRPGSGTYVLLSAPSTSYQFGLLIPELGSTEIFEPICRGIMGSPQAKSHSLIWGHTSQENSSKEEGARSLCRQFIEQKVSGVFFAPLEFVEDDSINHQLVTELREAGIPIVLLDRCYYPYPSRSNLDLVGIDNHRASFVVTQHLWNRGARRIVFVARTHSASTMIERVSGYQFALGECGSQFVPRALYGDVEDVEFVRHLVEDERPDGVVCGNDLTAAHLMRGLIGMGVRVPQQIRLVSFDDVSYAKFLPVPLTTIRQNCPQIGESAMELMLDRIQHPNRPAVDLLVPFELVVRESCGPASEAQSKASLANGSTGIPTRRFSQKPLVVSKKQDS
jgi:GntR family transcriptional regulator, arabinose operon transcriptional repressor